MDDSAIGTGITTTSTLTDASLSLPNATSGRLLATGDLRISSHLGYADTAAGTLGLIQSVGILENFGVLSLTWAANSLLSIWRESTWHK